MIESLDLNELKRAISRVDAALLGGETLDDEPEFRAVEMVTNIARLLANGEAFERTAYGRPAQLGQVVPGHYLIVRLGDSRE